MNTHLSIDLQTLRQDAEAIFRAGVDAANPSRAIEKVLRMTDGRLKIKSDPQSESYRCEPWNRVHIIAIGKAACAMSQAVRNIIPESMLALPGLAVTNYENVVSIPDIEVLGSGHPLPDENGVNASQAVIKRLKAVRADDLALILISGGGSALLPCPPENIALPEKVATTNLLLASGADITQINTVRKHLSLLKGGGLAQLAAPASVHGLILSDVIGDDLSVIASGPTVTDSTTFEDSIRVLKSNKVWSSVPTSVMQYLEDGRASEQDTSSTKDKTPINNVQNTLIGGNSVSVKAAYKEAIRRGYQALVINHSLCGEAREEAEWLAKFMARSDVSDNTSPIAFLAGGETTVTLYGDGQGGRNQEMSLAFALHANKNFNSREWVFLSGGTDGRDGPTDAAGGLVDRHTLVRIREKGIDPDSLLQNNDSYAALNAADDLLKTGATGTNVADLQIGLLGLNIQR